MYIERPKALFQPCIIKPLDDQEGLIVRIRFDKCGAEVLVRYFVFSQVVYNWFYDFDVELKEPKESNKDFFKDYKK